VTLSVKLIDATFPDYEQVIPKNTTKRAVVHRQQLIDCLKRISLLSADSMYGVKMSFAKNTLTISSDDQKFGEAREQLDIEYSSEPMTIGINAQYMSDVLSASSDIEFGIALTDDISPCLLIPVDDSEYQCVVMPMRL
jgi:DNA polymerase-3 subunit beta